MYIGAVAVYYVYMTTSMTNQAYEDLVENHGLTRLPDGYRYEIFHGYYGSIFFELQKRRKYSWMGWKTVRVSDSDTWNIVDKKTLVKKLEKLYNSHFNPPAPPKHFIDDFVGTMP